MSFFSTRQDSEISARAPTSTLPSMASPTFALLLLFCRSARKHLTTYLYKHFALKNMESFWVWEKDIDKILANISSSRSSSWVCILLCVTVTVLFYQPKSWCHMLLACFSINIFNFPFGYCFGICCFLHLLSLNGCHFVRSLVSICHARTVRESASGKKIEGEQTKESDFGAGKNVGIHIKCLFEVYIWFYN